MRLPSISRNMFNETSFTRPTRKIIVFLFFFFSLTGSIAQKVFQFPSLSPKGTLSQVVGNTTIKVQYERPAVRSRTIFGLLVPWGEVWRTGAGHCTKITFNRPVTIAEKQVNSGTYSLLTIPNPEKWIVILNRDTTLYGSAFYDRTKDIARFEVVPVTTERFYESLTIDLDIIPNNAKLYISWEQTQISFPIKTTTDAEVEGFIHDELMSKTNGEYQNYAFAAEYFFFQNKNLRQALQLADKAIATGNDTGWARNIKINVYERLEAYGEAIDEIKVVIEDVKKAEYDDESFRIRDLKSLDTRLNQMKSLLKKN